MRLFGERAENEPATMVFVGAGPRTVGLLERFAASAGELLGGRQVRIHVVDPYPAGGGRIWRREQSRLLGMNSMASREIGLHHPGDLPDIVVKAPPRWPALVPSVTPRGS